MFVRTPRLLLRPGWREDAPALAQTIGDESVVRNLATAPWPYGLADAETFLSRSGSDDAPDRLPGFLITARTAGPPRLVGGIGLNHDPEGEVELGYWIGRPYWGLGFATEAARGVVALARDGLRLRRIAAWHFLDNPASGNVLRKLGFRSSGRVANRHSAARGRSAPCLHYTLDFAGEEDPSMPMAA